MTDGYTAWRRNIGREQTANRFRSLGYCLLALLYAVLAERLAAIIASGFRFGVASGLVSQVLFLVLLVGGYLLMSVSGVRRRPSLGIVGLPLREGRWREWAIGAALGWSGVVAAVLPLALFGELAVGLDTNANAWTSLLLNAVTLFVATLTQEVIFRGYPFQRLIETVGPTLATVLMALLFTGLRSGNAEDASASTLNSLLLGLLLGITYLRTRAIWMSWGLRFAWVGATALLFGLPTAGSTEFSSVVQTYADGPLWLGGGGYGPEGSVIATFILLGLIVVAMMVTRELRHRWAMPMIVGAGMPVDIDAISQKQHEAGMGPGAAAAPAGSTLVQILPATQPVPPSEGNVTEDPESAR